MDLLIAMAERRVLDAIQLLEGEPGLVARVEVSATDLFEKRLACHHIVRQVLQVLPHIWRHCNKSKAVCHIWRQYLPETYKEATLFISQTQQ